MVGYCFKELGLIFIIAVLVVLSGNQYIIVYLSLRLRVFDSGVMVVQLQSHSEEEMIASAIDNVSVKSPSYFSC